MDACNELEGVSAAPVLGFTAWELCQFAFLAGSNPKIGYLELAEVAPSLDPTGRGARIAAEVIYYFTKGILNRVSRVRNS
jgi:arginase family enzyme